MPKGTYLSNPATAASGGLGGPQGSNPPPGGMAPVGQPAVPQINTGSFTGFLQKLFQQYTGTNPMAQTAVNLAQDPLNPYRTQNTPYTPPKTLDPRITQPRGTFGQTIDTKQQPTSPTNLFKTPVSPSNDLVGNDIGSAPEQLDWNTLKQIAPGKTFEEVQAGLVTKGYVWDWRNRVFVQSGQSGSTEQLAQGQQSFLRDNNNRVFANPYEIGPTLAPGERVVTAGTKTEAGTTVGSGVGVTGGTSYTDANGNTVQQYAVSYGSGGDRWKFKISQDNAGNWVRTYYRTFSKARSRSALKRKQNRNKQNTPDAQDYQNGREDNQLVNFRANFG